MFEEADTPFHLVKISDIMVSDRRREDPGDLTGLKESIQRLGILQPIGITPNCKLLWGYRRLTAAAELKMALVPVVVVNSLDSARDLLLAEREENTERLELTPSEKAKFGLLLEEELAPAAKEQQAQAGRDTAAKRVGKYVEPETPAVPVHVSKEVAQAVGMGQHQYEGAKAVVLAAEASPAEHGDLPVVMDEQGVAPAKKELDKRKKEKGEPPPKRGRPKKQKPVQEVEVLDALEQIVPSHLKDVFDDGFLDGLCDNLNDMIGRLNVPAISAAGSTKVKFLKYLDLGKLLEALRAAQHHLELAASLGENGKPYAMCERCGAKPGGCGECRNSGYLNAARHHEQTKSRAEVFGE